MIRDRPYGYYGQTNRERAVPIEMDERDAVNSRLTVMKVAKSMQNPPKDLNRPFSDEEFRCLPTDLDGVDRNNRVVWQRLSELLNPVGRLFAAEHFSHFDKMPHLPTFFSEVGLLPPFHYETLFITPDFTNNGMYKIIANVQGEFRVIVIDDMIPVYEHNMEPIWGMNPQVAWELLLLKAWAKIVGGYRNIATNCRPFEFLRTFTFPGWRLKNLQRFNIDSAWRFLNTKLKGDMLPYNPQNMGPAQNLVNLQEVSNTKMAYDPPPGQTYFTIIAKTKNNQRIEACGLEKNAAAYQVTNVLDIKGRKAVKIVSSIDSRWNGDFSVIDQKVNTLYDPQTHDLNLTRSFIMPFEDFMKLFGLILITNINYRQLPSVKHTSYTVDLPPMQKQSQHFKLMVREPGMFCLSVIQGVQNMVQNLQRQKGPVLARAVAKPGQQQTMSVINGNTMRMSQMNIQVTNAPSNAGNQMQTSRPLSPMDQQIRTLNLASSNIMNLQNVKTSSLSPNLAVPPVIGQSTIPQSPARVSGIQPNMDTLVAQMLVPGVMNNTIGQVNVSRPPLDPWQNRNPWPDTTQPPIPGSPLRSTMRPMSPLPQQKDPWLNRNPWTDMPATIQMGSIMQPPNLIQPTPPIISQSRMNAPTNIATRDPWENKNPWSMPPGLPPLSQNQPSFGQVPIASNALVPGVTQITTSRVSVTQPPLDPWQNRDPWGPNSPAQMPFNRVPVVNQSIRSPTYQPGTNIPQYNMQSGAREPSPINNFNSASVIQQVTMDPWLNRDPWKNPPTLGPPSLRGGGGPETYISLNNQYNGQTSQTSGFLPTFNQITEQIRPSSPVTSLHEYSQGLVPKQSISIPFNNLNIPTNPGYNAQMPTYNPPLQQNQGLSVPTDKLSQLSYGNPTLQQQFGLVHTKTELLNAANWANQQTNNYVNNITGSREFSGNFVPNDTSNPLMSSHTRPLDTTQHLQQFMSPQVTAQSPMQLSRSPSASMQPQVQSKFGTASSMNGMQPQISTFGPTGNQSYLPYNPQLRFLSNRILLSRATNNKRMNTSRPGPLDFLSESQDSHEFIDIDQLHGYTAGQAYFYKLQPGEYILTVKLEACQKPTSYTVNFMSQMPTIASALQLQKVQKSLVARSTLLDFSRERGDKSYLDERGTQWVSFGPTFTDYGYGFISFCSEKGAPFKLYCEINTRKLREQGYELKDLYKQKDGLVGVFSQDGIGKCIILKRRRLDAVWPPTAIAIYQTRTAQ